MIYFSPSTGGFFDSALFGKRRVLVPDPDWIRPTIEVPEPGWSPPLIDVPAPDWKRPLVLVDDPDWVRPTEAQPDPDWSPPKGKKKGRRRWIRVPVANAAPPQVERLDEAAVHPTVSVPDPSAEVPLVTVPDPLAEHPMVEVDNPACRLPADAVEISEGLHAELMTAQAQGKRIVAGEAGLPIAVDDVWDAETTERARRARRNWLLQASDWTQLPDVLAGMEPARAAAWVAYRQSLRDLDLTAEPFEFPATPA